MNTRTLIFVTSLTFCGFSVTGVAWQSRHLHALRDESHRLRQHLEDVRAEAVESIRAAAETVVSPPSEELLRLRNQVSQLTRRERELATVQSENERLRMQAAAARTNKVQLPAGLIRKSQAGYVGWATPEATIETFLWAVRNRDLNTLLACYTPEEAAQMKRQIEQAGRSAESFLKEMELIPGIQVVDRIPSGEDSVMIKVEMLPGGGAQSSVSAPMSFKRINGEWKLGR